jgi:AsmA family protein
MPPLLRQFSQHKLLTGSGFGLLGLCALITFWNWNWLKPIVAHEIGVAIGRPVTLARFDIKDLFTRDPLIVLDGISVGNPPDFPKDSQLGTVDRLSFRFDLPAALRSAGGDIILSEVAIEHPQGDLRAGPSGKPNWAFNLPSSGGASNPPRIGALIITDGMFRFSDPKRKADLEVRIRTEQPRGGGEPKLVASAQGTYAGQPFKGNFVGGSLLSLRDPKKPYPIDLVATNGPTRIALKGTILDPSRMAGANLQLELSGQDLAHLYPILGLPLAETPPFTLRGHLDYNGTHIKLSKFTGTVGKSDLAGDFDVDRGHGRPLITADLSSRNVLLTDLGGFLGTAPDQVNTPNQAPEHKAQIAQREASASLLPDEPFDLTKLRSTDFRVHYKGQHIEAQWAPLDNIDVNLTIDNGKVLLQPLNFGIGAGTIASTLLLDAQRNPIHAEASVDFRQVDFQRIMQATKRFDGIGVVGGRAELSGDGNSPAAMLANGNGDLKLFMNGGNVSALLVNLAGLDFGKALLSALGLPDKAMLRCMVSDFALEQGVLKTRALVFDTDEANVIGKGDVDLRNQTIDFEISQDPKHFSVLAIHAPINVKGPLKNPSITPDPGQLGVKAGLAVITGLLATVQLGLGQDHNCSDLIRSAEQSAEAPPQLPQAPPRPAEGSQPVPKRPTPVK